MSKALFELKGWGIFTASKSDLSAGIGVYGIHIRCGGDMGQEYLTDRNQTGWVSWLKGEYPQCWNCKSKVPDEIQGLIHLYGWDTK